MSDVREAVSSLRESDDIDFENLVLLLVNNLPNLSVHTQIDTRIALDELELAKTLLSCIQEASTNCLKHANANEFWISLKQDDQSLRLELYDNGQVDKNYKEGNGLTGMRERVHELDGDIELSILQNSLKICINIPLSSIKEQS
jgi:signal transduction histidine kinase